MRPTDKIDSLFKTNLKTSASPELDRRIDDLIVRFRTTNTGGPNTWSIFMKKTYKLAAAAIVIIAALLSLTLLDKTVSSVYAFEQTVAACHSVRFIHIRKLVPGQEEPIMVWAEFFDNGLPKAIRLHLPEWKNGPDGAKEVVWKDDIAEVWFKKKNCLLRVREQRLADEILQTVKENDPKTFVQTLMQKHDAGECELRIDQPADKAQPIVVTAIALPDKAVKLVLSVDQATQLPLSLETYGLREGAYVLLDTGEFYDYNQSVDPAMFTFENLPADVMRVDQVATVIGLEQGQLTADEAAVEVVRCFWQAIIDKDYATASRMYDGVPAATLEQGLGTLAAFRIEIVSVGPVMPHPNPQTGGVVVPCTLKGEKDGKTEELKFDRIGVRQVYNQPGRWTIFGGI